MVARTARERPRIGAAMRDTRCVVGARVDPAQAHRVAAAFLDAPRSIADPLVDAAYESLGFQASRWFERLAGCSARERVRVVFTSWPEPYATAADLAEHVEAERLLELCPAKYDRDRSHPLLDTSVGGAFDRLRAVHDIVSHVGCGYGFDRDGEFSAWLNEDRLYVGLARWALATELHAQHSVLWTTGSLAEHKATLLPLELLAASHSARSLSQPRCELDVRESVRRRRRR